MLAAAPMLAGVLMLAAGLALAAGPALATEAGAADPPTAVAATLGAAAASTDAAAARAPAEVAASASTSVRASLEPGVPDTIAQRVLACTGCHGEQGRATPDGYFPRIAGKPAAYLYQQLLNFRDGRRHYPMMTNLIDNLSDDYLREIAGYFADLQLPYPAPKPSGASAESLARGKSLVLDGDPALELPACAQCHGSRLTGVEPAIPGLLGLSRDYLNGQLGAWRTGLRHAYGDDCMAKIARKLGSGDVGAVTAWLSGQPVPQDSKPAATLEAPLPMPCGMSPQ